MSGKATFADVYAQDDPRAYFETLGGLGYEIPAHGREVFAAVLSELSDRVDQPQVLDVCCSYGINAGLLNHDVGLEDLYAHYAGADGMSRDDLVARDRRYYASHRRPDAVDVIGLDSSGPAVTYARDVGLLAEGIVADLENHPLHPDDAGKIADVDLITVTGGVGYVNERTFAELVDAVDEPPWIAALSLRWVDFDPIAETLEDAGLVTERFEGYVVPQRRFADESERAFVLSELEARDIDPTGAEERGVHCAELYLVRPEEDIDAVPLDAVFNGNGGRLITGTRQVRGNG